GKRQRWIELVAGHHQVIGYAVTAVLRVMASDDAELIRLPGQERQVLHEAHARQRGGDRAKVAANFCGSVRLRVKGVHMAWAALHPEQDAVDGLLGRTLGCQGMAQAQETGQRQPENRKTADSDEFSA